MEEPICEMLYPSPVGGEIGNENRVYLSIIMDIGQLPLTLIKSGVAILKEKDESYNLQVENWI